MSGRASRGFVLAVTITFLVLTSYYEPIDYDESPTKLKTHSESGIETNLSLIHI